METFKRIVKLGINNFRRNRWLTVGATLLMTLTLTMISVSLLITFVINDTTEAIRDKISLSIYFRDDKLPDSSITDLQARIKLLPDVIEVDFFDKLRALEIFHRLPINENIKAPIGADYNPLPRSLEIRSNDVENLTVLQRQIESADTDKIICSECLSLNQNKETVDRLVSGTRAAQQAGWLLSAFFALIAIFNVSNIIRLTIAARSDEIEIMRYVGASNSFIRGPFIIEGILYGILGTIVTTITLPLLARFLLLLGSGQQVSGAFSFLGMDLSSYIISKLSILVIVQLLIGLGLGTFVSIVSVRRYLRA